MTATDPDQDYECRLPDGRIICYREYGSREGYPVLALHGTPGSRLKYRVTHKDAEKRRLRLVTPDRWGYGRSSRHPQPVLSAYAADARALMRHCQVDRFCVVGISGGGPFAAAVAAGYPDCVSALALVAPVGRVAEPDHRGPMTAFHNFCFRALPRIPGGVRVPFEVLRGLAVAAPATSIRLATARAGHADKQLMAPYGKRLPLGLTFKEGLRRGVAGPIIDMKVFSEPWGIDPGAISCPAHLWIGDQDRNVPITAARRLAAEIPKCEITALSDQGHFWISGNFGVVLDWLAQNCKAEGSQHLAHS